MTNNLKSIYRQLTEALCPEDIFDVVEAAPEEQIKTIYRSMVKTVHPDRYQHDPELKELANEAFLFLEEFYNQALLKVEKGIYGNRQESIDTGESRFTIKTAKREYHIRTLIAQGDLSTLYKGDCAGGGQELINTVAVKVIENPEDNDFMQNEIRTLKSFQEEPSKQSKHLPVFIDQFKTTDNQLGLVMKYIDGFDLYTIREKYKDGVPDIHAAWILERLLSILGFVHSKGIIHTNIDPAHIMVRPRDHNVYLIDWGYSVIRPGVTDQGFKILNEDYSPPEVEGHKHPIPASDLYSSGKCMVYLLGGDIQTDLIPDKVNPAFRRFVEFFLRKSPLQRAQDAWEMYNALKELRTEIWGSKKFVEFLI